jgi:hypothetical protein
MNISNGTFSGCRGCEHLLIKFLDSRSGTSLVRLACRHPCYNGGQSLIACLPSLAPREFEVSCPLRTDPAVAELLAPLRHQAKLEAASEDPPDDADDWKEKAR